MSEAALHQWLVRLVLLLAALTAVVLVFVVAPYGRHSRAGWGPTLPERLGWIAMETPAVLLFLLVFLRGAHAGEWLPLSMLGLWQLHYVHRTFIYPFRIRSRGKRMPLVVVLLGMGFQALNAWLNARFVSEFGRYPGDWWLDPRFIAGTALFMAGFAINLRADRTLIALRADAPGAYRIPYGGLYRWVSCPNYLGELIEWVGWALLTWSGAGLAFAVYTAANLVPRALSHHRWYRDTFPDYPRRRRAILPGLL